MNKELKAPIKPRLKGEGDTKHVDGVFLNEEIMNTPPKDHNNKESFHLKLMAKMHFDNFTYNESAIVSNEQTDLGKSTIGDAQDPYHLSRESLLNKDKDP